jgi:ACS family tartrate transporter-like MFS transporter
MPTVPGAAQASEATVAMTAESRNDAVLISKIRWRLLPLMFAAYIIAYIDRVNIGFAALQMNADLGFSATVYGLGAGVFFIGYFVFEVPSNLIMERLGARLWIARIMISWGFISAAMMFTKGPVGFYSLRFFLGVAEAGFFPGMILYLTYWFPGNERARAVALFMTANAFAGVVGGPLAGALLTMDGIGGLRGWQWLFLVEGIAAVVIGAVVFMYLPDGPHDTRWLTGRERRRLEQRLGADYRAEDQHRRSLRQVLTDRRVWLFCWLYLALVIGLYSISFWLPQILRRLSNASDLLIGVLSALPYIFAVIGMVWIGRHSDRTGERRWHVAVPALLAAGGLLLCGFTATPGLALAALSLAALGIWGALGPFWAMPTAMLSRSEAAAGIAWINSVGNLGGFVGPYAVGVLSVATGSLTVPMGALSASLMVAAILALRVPNPSLEEIH